MNIVFHNFKNAPDSPCGSEPAPTRNGDELGIDHHIRRPAYAGDEDGVHTLWEIFAGQRSVLENQTKAMLQPTLPAILIGLNKTVKRSSVLKYRQAPQVHDDIIQNNFFISSVKLDTFFSGFFVHRSTYTGRTSAITFSLVKEPPFELIFLSTENQSATGAWAGGGVARNSLHVISSGLVDAAKTALTEERTKLARAILQKTL